MTLRGRKYVLGCAGVGLLLLIALGAGFFWYASQARDSTQQSALQVAQRLGMREGDQLVVGRRCWAALTQCGRMIIFTTSLTQEQIGSQIQTLGYKTLFEGSGNGSSIFSDININTSHSFTANGNEDPYGGGSSANQPDARDWLLIAPSTRGVDIHFYATLARPVQYAFDGRPLAGNIVEVLVWEGERRDPLES